MIIKIEIVQGINGFRSFNFMERMIELPSAKDKTIVSWLSNQGIDDRTGCWPPSSPRLFPVNSGRKSVSSALKIVRDRTYRLSVHILTMHMCTKWVANLT